jgi:hypothetical protein
MQALQGENVELMGASHEPWAVAYLDTTQPPPPSALHRTVCVVAVDTLDDAVTCLTTQGAYLQTVGLMTGPEELFRLAPLLGQAGATRLCAIGNMTAPESGWHHDGRFSLLDLVRMVDIEASAEQTAESLASYRD